MNVFNISLLFFIKSIIGDSMAAENKQDISLDVFLRIADVATALRRQQEQVQNQLSASESKADLKERLLNAAKSTGENLTPEIADAAIENYYAGLYSFKAPNKDWKYRLARLYVDRIKITKRYVIPSVAVVAAVVAVYYISKGIIAANLALAEKSVENKIEEAYQQREMFLSQLHGFRVSPFLQETFQGKNSTSLPNNEKQKFNAALAELEQRLSASNSFFNEFCSDGTADDDINKGNYEQARDDLTKVIDGFDAVKVKMGSAEDIIITHQAFLSMRKEVDSLIAEIRTSNVPHLLLERAELLYTNALTNIENRQLDSATSSQQQLSGLQREISQYSGLVVKLSQVYANIQAMAKETDASKDANGLYQEALQAKDSGDVRALSANVQSLIELEAVLNQEYTIYIIGGDRRVPDNNPNITRYYLLVEARDAKGRTVEMAIKHEETNETVKVRSWGERVGTGPRSPEEEPLLYARLKADKMDNDIIDNNKFGEKRRGYRSIDVTIPDVNGKPFTRQAQYPY